MPRYPHADHAVFTSSIQKVLHRRAPFEHGALIDRLLTAIRDQFDALSKLDRIYSEAGCDFGYIHFRNHSGRLDRARRRQQTGFMVVTYPTAADGFRPRKYIGADPLKQFEASSAIERYKLRNELRLEFVAVHEHYAQIVESLEQLSQRTVELRQTLSLRIKDASEKLSALENEHKIKRSLLDPCNLDERTHKQVTKY